MHAVRVQVRNLFLRFREEHRVPGKIGVVCRTRRRHGIIRLRRIPLKIEDERVHRQLAIEELLQRVFDVGAIPPAPPALHVSHGPARRHGRPSGQFRVILRPLLQPRRRHQIQVQRIAGHRPGNGPVGLVPLPVAGRIIIFAQGQHAVAGAAPIIRHAGDAIAHPALPALLQDASVHVPAAVDCCLARRRAHRTGDLRPADAVIAAEAGQRRRRNNHAALAVLKHPLPLFTIHQQRAVTGLHSAERAVAGCLARHRRFGRVRQDEQARRRGRGFGEGYAQAESVRVDRRRLHAQRLCGGGMVG